MTDTLLRAAEDAIKRGAFNEAILAVALPLLRNPDPERQLSEVGFVAVMAVAIYDADHSNHRSWEWCKKQALLAWQDFQHENGVVFCASGWDWSADGARAIAREYVTDHFERQP